MASPRFVDKESAFMIQIFWTPSLDQYLARSSVRCMGLEPVNFTRVYKVDAVVMASRWYENYRW